MNKTALSKGLFITYLLLLGICIGVEISVGALVAPVIFYPASFLGNDVLTHFQSGILMTQIFLRFNMLLMFITVFLFFCEVAGYFKGKGDLFSFILILIILCCAILFVFYYTPFIVEAQSIGAKATLSEKFLSMHKASEVVLKVAIVMQICLFFRKIFVEIK